MPALDLPALLAATPVFRGLNAPEIARLAQAAIPHTLAKDVYMFRRGDPARSFYIIASGWIKLTRETQEGEAVTLGLLNHPATFGEIALFSGEAQGFSAQAVEAAQIVAIPASTLKEMARQNPHMLVSIVQAMSQQMKDLLLEKEHLAVMSAPQRVGCHLLQLIPAPDQPGMHVINLPYEKSLAASRLGMKPETFSRALAQLKDIGITVTGNTVRINALGDLVDFVCADCSACHADCAFAALHHCGA